MRIAIDARLNAYRAGGIPQYTRQLMTALASIAVEHQIISLQHRDHLRPLVIAPNVVRHPLFTPPHHRFERSILPLEVLIARPDVLHFPDFIAPRYRFCPTVVTIHDLAFLRYSDILDRAAAAYYRQVGNSATHADAVIAVSETTRQDIAQFLDLSPEQIDVVYEAAAPIYKPLSLRPGEVRVLSGVPLTEGAFMLFVSTLEPRKNLPTLLQALRICLDRRPGRGYRLVVAGARGWRDEGIFTAVRDLHLEENVIFAGYVGQYDLRWLYNACRLYVNPSLYEGFGLPLLEAMACGAACLASSSSSLPEIGGDAVEYVPALDAGAWADSIEALWDDPDRRATMGRLARARAEQFSWQRTARETLAIYRRVVAHTPRPSSLSVAMNVAPSPHGSPDRLETCIRCGQRLVPTQVEGTIVVGTSQKRRITPRAWICTHCRHVELLATPAEAQLPAENADTRTVTSQKPGISSESGDFATQKPVADPSPLVVAPAVPSEPALRSDRAPDLPADPSHKGEAIPGGAPERETVLPGDQVSSMETQRQEGVEGA
ncbi:MAG: glycosyltransferase family 4 protein [Roseiflexus sp.]